MLTDGRFEQPATPSNASVPRLALNSLAMLENHRIDFIIHSFRGNTTLPVRQGGRA